PRLPGPDSGCETDACHNDADRNHSHGSSAAGHRLKPRDEGEVWPFHFEVTAIVLGEVVRREDAVAPLHTKAPRERRGRRDVEIEPRAVEIARGELERREFADDRDVTVHVRAGTRAKRRHGCIGFRQLAPTDAPDRRAHPVVLDLAHDADRAALARYDIPL